MSTTGFSTPTDRRCTSASRSSSRLSTFSDVSRTETGGDDELTMIVASYGIRTQPEGWLLTSYFFFPAFRCAQYAFILSAAAFRAAVDHPRRRPVPTAFRWRLDRGGLSGRRDSPCRSCILEGFLNCGDFLAQLFQASLCSLPGEGKELVVREVGRHSGPIISGMWPTGWPVWSISLIRLPRVPANVQLICQRRSYNRANYGVVPTG